jgi:hypothetical protein
MLLRILLLHLLEVLRLIRLLLRTDLLELFLDQLHEELVTAQHSITFLLGSIIWSYASSNLSRILNPFELLHLNISLIHHSFFLFFRYLRIVVIWLSFRKRSTLI